ncbi:MAG: Na+/H+ antiporter subunit E [Burkholderiaceae bacterium]
MKRWFPAPVLSVFLLLMWLLLNQTLEPAHWLLGAALGFALPLATRRLRPRVPRIRRPGAIVRLFFVVLYDIVKSNVNVAKVILGGRHRRETSGFMTIPLDLRDPHGLAVLSSIINSTPGTVWGELSPDRRLLMIHVLDLHDEQWWIDTIKNRYERPLRSIFE